MSEEKKEGTEVQDGAKEAIYVKIQDWVKTKTGKNIGKSGGREIFDLVHEETFAVVVRAGSFRFNGGFGSLHTKTYGAGKRRLPSGQETQFGERHKVRYEEGVVVKELIKNGGDLQKAIATARGSRAKAEEQKPAPKASGSKASQASAAPQKDESDVDLS